MRVDLIWSGGLEMQRLRSLRAPPPPPLTRAELEAALGEPVARCDLWWAKWESRIYRVELARLGPVIAKQLCTHSATELLQEYEQLQALAQLPVAGLHMPRPVALLAERHTYLLELARGQSLQSLLWAGDGSAELPAACGVAGQVLARLHAAWTTAIGPLPVDALWQDLRSIPGGFSTRARDSLRRALDRLARHPVAVGQPYLDFNPRNVFYHEGTISLIDPPEECRQGILLWDCATFSADLRREQWKSALLRPWRRRRALVEESLTAFAQAYWGTYAGAHPEVPVSPLLGRILELQRVGQLMAQRVEQFRLVVRHEKNPLPRSSNRLGGVLMALASLGLLETQKRWLLRQIARGGPP
jgi:Ser/Thr protein kinase RdoA (MazF antagonist)